jgi:hypothetical protein
MALVKNSDREVIATIQPGVDRHVARRAPDIGVHHHICDRFADGQANGIADWFARTQFDGEPPDGCPEGRDLLRSRRCLLAEALSRQGIPKYT